MESHNVELQQQELCAMPEEAVAHQQVGASTLDEAERQLASAMISASSPLPFRLQ